MTPEQLERLRNEARRFTAPPVFHRVGTSMLTANINAVSFDDDQDFSEEELIDDEQIAQLMKSRHLTKAERHALHKPKSDWIEGRRGEECRAAHELRVDDIVPVSLRVKK